MDNKKDITVLRELAKKYMDAFHSRDVENIKKQWRDLHDFNMSKPMIYIWVIIFTKELEEITNLKCKNGFYKNFEQWLRTELYHHYCGDDYVLSPYYMLRASFTQQENGPWGLVFPSHDSAGGAKNVYLDPPVKDLNDLSVIKTYEPEVDEESTQKRFEMLQEAVGDILPIYISRVPQFYFNNSIAPLATSMRGMTQIMMDMMDNPDGLHNLLRILQKKAIETQEKTESENAILAFDQHIQSCPYSTFTLDPGNDAGVKRTNLWSFMQAQEFTQVSPAMHKEFALDYQKPIMERFAASAYGCCEDITNKIDILREVKNLKRISVTPASDLEKCAEQIGSDYIISWRPNPTDQVCVTFDRDRIKRIITEGKKILDSYGCQYEINLKDVVSICKEGWRLKEWVDIVRSIVDN
jgi:hypothetical protein